MRIGLALVLASALVAAPLSAAPGDMDVATFLVKAEKLEKKGVTALFSSDLKVLKREVEASAEAYRAQIKSDRAAGRTAHSCPPAKGAAKLGSDELLAHFRSYPAAKRSSMTVRSGFFDMMAKRFPCR